jgi:hypothetical protein
MAEMEPGHPDELTEILKNWLREAQSPIGSLPEGTDPVEWAVRRFIATWKKSARLTIEAIEECLESAQTMCDSGQPAETIKAEIDMARQFFQEDLRDHLGLYEWN